MELRVEKAKKLKERPQDESKLGFGKIFSDHMFIMEYDKDKGWHDARIQPYGNLSLSPAAKVLHYSQEAFEGTKAYIDVNGKTRLFRPEKNFERMNNTADRLCMPRIDVDFVLESLEKLIEIDKDWVPKSKGTSLYIRPTLIGIDPYLGVEASHSYLFYIITGPVGAYYESGLAPVKIYVEDKYVRAVKGGTGAAKTGGNYAASLIASEYAHGKGFEQALWLDGRENKYIEEVGSMNIMFVINNVIVTPPLGGSILPGITRDSIITLAKHMGYKVEERKISIDEVISTIKDGSMSEAFGTGTAAVISPVGDLAYGGEVYKIGNGQMGKVSHEMYNTLTGIQYGEIEDEFGWTRALNF